MDEALLLALLRRKAIAFAERRKIREEVLPEFFERALETVRKRLTKVDEIIAFMLSKRLHGFREGSLPEHTHHIVDQLGLARIRVVDRPHRNIAGSSDLTNTERLKPLFAGKLIGLLEYFFAGDN